MWKVSSNTATVYLLGSMHMATPEMFPLPREVEEAFAKSDTLVVEVNINKGKQATRAEFRAPVIVSDAGAWNTFTRMVPACALPFRDQLTSPP